MSNLSQNPSDAELVRLGVTSAMTDLFKAGAGIIASYDPETNTAQVQPAVRHAMRTTDGERVFEDLPLLVDVPVVFLRGGGFVSRAPLNAGDSVLVIYLDVSHAEWRNSGGVGEPRDARRHSIGHAVAIAGFFPDSSPMSSTDAAAILSGQMVVGQDGGKQMRIGPTGIELAPAGVTPINHVALAEPVLAQLSNIQLSLAAIQGWIAVASPYIAAIPAPLTTTQQTALGGLVTTSGTALTTASTGLATATASAPSTLVRAV